MKIPGTQFMLKNILANLHAPSLRRRMLVSVNPICFSCNNIRSKGPMVFFKLSGVDASNSQLCIVTTFSAPYLVVHSIRLLSIFLHCGRHAVTRKQKQINCTIKGLIHELLNGDGPAPCEKQTITVNNRGTEKRRISKNLTVQPV